MFVFMLKILESETQILTRPKCCRVTALYQHFPISQSKQDYIKRYTLVKLVLDMLMTLTLKYFTTEQSTFALLPGYQTLEKSVQTLGEYYNLIL